MRTETRRGFLAQSLWVGVATVLGRPVRSWSDGDRVGAIARPTSQPFAHGRRLGILPFLGGEDRLEVIYDIGKDRRFRQDLTLLTPDTLITPTARFYIRTGFADEIDYDRPWTVRVHGLVAKPHEIPIQDLTSITQPMGVHLQECNGSGKGGLISAAKWHGIPIARLLAQAKRLPRATRVRISGFSQWSKADPESGEVFASWVFSFEQLKRAGAFLATRMNGKPLTRDHGFPIRLVMPGWYGCASIKWVNSIEFVDDTAPAPVHMLSYADNQDRNRPLKLAGDVEPRTIDIQAMPVRVEKWRASRRIVHRVVGILWGGQRTTDKLVIRFHPDEPYAPVESYRHTTHRTWSLWSHTWRPRKPGHYDIRLQVDDPTIRTRRLDAGYYERSVEVTEV